MILEAKFSVLGFLVYFLIVCF